MSKKGQKQLWWIITAAVVAIVASIIILGGSSKAFTNAFGGVEARFDDLGDCDQDRVANLFDKCPCLSTQGDGDKRLRGCPVGITNEAAALDQKTCEWFAAKMTKDQCVATDKTCFVEDDTVYIPDCDSKDKPCQEFEPGKQKKNRCGLTQETIEPVADTAGKGVKGNWDLTGELQVFNSRTGQPLFDALVGQAETVGDAPDLQKRESDIVYGVQIVIRNEGEELIPETIPAPLARFYVCKNKNDNCQPIKFSENPQMSALQDAVSLPGIRGKKEYTSKMLYIRVGANGDACDGVGLEMPCYVKVKLDDSNEYDELAGMTENNNEIGFRVNIRNQYSLQVFNQYKVIEIFSNGFEDRIIGIRNHCAASKQVSECAKELNPSNSKDGSFATDEDPSGRDRCLIFATEDGVDDDNLGAAFFAQGTIIDSSAESNFFNSHEDYVGGDTDAKELFEKGRWNNPDGALICHKKIWHRCDEQVTGKNIVVGSNNYVCQNEHWVLTTEPGTNFPKHTVINFYASNECDSRETIPQTVWTCDNTTVAQCAISQNTEKSTDGKYPITSAPGTNCWGFLTEIDDGADDLWAAHFLEQTIIPGNIALATSFWGAYVGAPGVPVGYSIGGDSEAACVLSNVDKWHHKFGGSLICKANFWIECNAENANKQTLIGGNNYLCARNMEWLKIE